MKIENFKLKIIPCFFVVTLCFMFSTTEIFANIAADSSLDRIVNSKPIRDRYRYDDSGYVLPYPSLMPGSKFYQIRLIWDEVKKYWYFGNFGQFKYNLKEADKYLVEAKTLFEYKQYLLGYNALKKSNSYFEKTFPYLIKAQKENKDISKSLLLFKEAALEHIELLKKAESQTPETFLWQPEKSLPTKLEIKNLIEQSIAIREKYL